MLHNADIKSNKQIICKRIRLLQLSDFSLQGTLGEASHICIVLQVHKHGLSKHQGVQGRGD